MNRLVISLVPVVLLVAAPGLKKTIQLHTTQPAVVRLANSSIAFTAREASAEYAPVRESLIATLETELLGNERTLTKKAVPAEADWTLALRITGYSLGQPRRRTETVQGSKTTTNYVRWVGSLNVAYDVLDKGGKVHDAGNVNHSYDKEFIDSAKSARGPDLSKIPGLRRVIRQEEQGPNTPDELKQILIREVVQQIAKQLGNTPEVIKVQVAGGEDQLNRTADFIEQKLWARALEELEKMPAFPKPEDEAYRQYDIGLVYEAMSYDARTAKDQRANLFKAQEHYDKALELKRDEKYFVGTIARTRNAIARYRTLDQMQQDDLKKKTETAASKSAPVAPAEKEVKVESRSRQAKVLTLKDVIEMRSAGVPNDQIKEVINASQVEFDPVAMESAIAIAKAKLPVDVQNELRKKVGAPLLAESAKPAATKPGTPKPAGPPKKQL